jgi:Lon protease-like protein
MTPMERVEAAASKLKVFPLPSAVMFPHAILPLHLFEERYRAMMRDALAGDGVIAIAQLEPGWEPHYAGRPPMAPLACAGVVAWHEEVPDGTFNLLLQGVCRITLLEEHPPEQLYREVRVRLHPDPPYQGPEEELIRRAILELATHLPQEEAAPLVQLAARAKGGALADGVASAVVGEVERRYQLLCDLDPGDRLRQVIQEVGGLIASMDPPEPTGPLN